MNSKLFASVPFVLATVVLTGCSGGPSGDSPAANPDIRLSAAFVSPKDIGLRWTSQDAAAAGFVVEFATESAGPFTTLEHVPAGATRYTHPDLAPDTTFYYRVRPYYGPASSAVEVVMPEAPEADKADEDLDHTWANPQKRDVGGDAPKQPIRRAAAMAGAAPSDLKASIMHARGVKFTWTDRANDEEGYLVEVKAEGSPDYRVAAVLDADINSFGMITLPHEKKAAYRVRPIYFGTPSNLEHLKTSPETPPQNTTTEPTATPAS